MAACGCVLHQLTGREEKVAFLKHVCISDLGRQPLTGQRGKLYIFPPGFPSNAQGSMPSWQKQRFPSSHREAALGLDQAPTPLRFFVSGHRKHGQRRPVLPRGYLGGPVVFILPLQTLTPFPPTAPPALPSFLSSRPTLSNKKNFLIMTCSVFSNPVAISHVRLLSTCSHATEERNFYSYILSNLNVNGCLWLVAACWKTTFLTFVFNLLPWAGLPRGKLVWEGEEIYQGSVPAEPRGKLGTAGREERKPGREQRGGPL